MITTGGRASALFPEHLSNTTLKSHMEEGAHHTSARCTNIISPRKLSWESVVDID